MLLCTNLKPKLFYEKKLQTIARNLVEKLLPYFITQDYECPTITLSEYDGSESIVLNQFVDNEISDLIREIPLDGNKFTLTEHGNNESFIVRVFKIYSPKNQHSRISLVAHKREVLSSSLSKYIPEFVDEFYDKDKNQKNYIIKAYTFGDFLDRNVSLERNSFDIPTKPNVLNENLSRRH